MPLTKSSRGLVLYFVGSIGRLELEPRGDAPPRGVSRPAGEAERRGELEPPRLPMPFPVGTYTSTLGSWGDIHLPPFRQDPFPWLKYIHPILRPFPLPFPLVSLLVVDRTPGLALRWVVPPRLRPRLRPRRLPPPPPPLGAGASVRVATVCSLWVSGVSGRRLSPSSASGVTS